LKKLSKTPAIFHLAMAATKKAVTTKKAATAKAPAGKAAKTAKATPKVIPPPKPAKPAKPKSIKSAKPAKAGKKPAPAAAKGSYTDYVVEAIQALQSDEKPFVGIQAIQGYIFSYIEAAVPASINRLAKSAIAKLIASKVLKKKRASVAFASGAGDLAVEAAPKRAIIREKESAPVDPGLEGGLIHKSNSGRISLKRF
jgi:hypothetical protein